MCTSIRYMCVNSKRTYVGFKKTVMIFSYKVVVVVLGFYVSPTAKVIPRWDLGLKSHPKDWRSTRSNSRPLD